MTTLEFLQSLNLDCINENLGEYSEATSYDELLRMIEENNGFDREIIYHSAALEYLAENDPSLAYSVELADEMGFTLKSINSELLASLLATANEREAFEDKQSEIEDFFEDAE